MTSRARQFLVKFTYIGLDVVCLSLCIWLVCWVRQETVSFPATFQNVFLSSVNPFRFVFLSWILITVLFNNSHGLYQTKREMFETVEVWKVLKSVILSSTSIIIFIYIVRVEDFPRSIVFLVTIFAVILLSTWRVFKRIFVGYLVSQGYNNFNVLIVGAGKVGETLAQEIDKRPELGLRIIGYLDDFNKDYSDSKKRKVLGKVVDFQRVVRQEFISKVFITAHHDSEGFLRLLEEAKEMRIGVRVVPHGFELMSGEAIKYNIGFIPILEYYDATPLRRQVGKRIFDIILVGGAIIFLLPIFFFIAILIKRDSKGPVFYASRRYGKAGCPFHMYKFRSMHMDADRMLDDIRHKNEVDGPIFKIKNDPRVTAFGKILRKYSIDELPQVWNVLKGEMSLVGPRPLPLDQVKKEDFRQLKRLEVKPGITGLWQVKGRSDISFQRLVKLDAWYINNWSLWLDLNILAQTIPVVLKGRGAY